MKKFWKEIGICVFMGLVVPGFILGRGTKLMMQTMESVPPQTVAVTVMAEEVLTPAGETEQKPVFTMQLLTGNGTVTEMEMDQYLVGVMLAEIPAYFGEEAIKAQSVAARTYTLRSIQSGKHSGAVCTNYACCQAYITQQDYLAGGGTIQDIEKVRSAVEAASGQVLTYEGQLIEATYFSCSGGSTEDAEAVWGADFPYLQAVESPGEENAEHYRDSVFFTAAEFNEALGTDFTGDPAQWIGEVTKTDGGGVDVICLGGADFKGTDVRRRLGLRSTIFTMAEENGGIRVTTRGFGHRVGMSQYGADAMAAQGSSYKDILSHYYQGAVLEYYQIPVA